MHWCKEHGVTSNAEDYWALPIGTLEDCRMRMEADVKRAEWEAMRGNHR